MENWIFHKKKRRYFNTDLDTRRNKWQLIGGWTNLSIKATLQSKVSTNIGYYQNISLQLLCILGRNMLAKFILP